MHPCDQFHWCLSDELRLLHLLFILPHLCLPVRLIHTRLPLRRVPPSKNQLTATTSLYFGDDSSEQYNQRLRRHGGGGIPQIWEGMRDDEVGRASSRAHL